MLRNYQKNVFNVHHFWAAGSRACSGFMVRRRRRVCFCLFCVIYLIRPTHSPAHSMFCRDQKVFKKSGESP